MEKKPKNPNDIVFKKIENQPVSTPKDPDEIKSLNDILKIWKENKDTNEFVSSLKKVADSKNSGELDKLKAFELLMQSMEYKGEHDREVLEYVIKSISEEPDRLMRESKLGIFGSRFQGPTLTREMADELAHKKGKKFGEILLKQFANTAETLKEIAKSDPKDIPKEIIDFAKMCIDNFSEDKTEEEILNKMREMALKYRGNQSNLNALLNKPISSLEGSKFIPSESQKTGRSVSEEAINNESIDAFFDKIKNLMANERISPRKFEGEGEYERDNVENDIRKSEESKQGQEKKRVTGDSKRLKERSSISEFLVFDLIKREKIFGENFTAHLPADYDDQRNKTDIIVEYKRKSRQTGKDIPSGAFLVDLTLDKKGQADKINEIKDKKNIGKIKYFLPKGAEKVVREEENKFPRLVLRLEKIKTDDPINDLMDLYDKKERTKEDIALLKKITEDILKQFIGLVGVLMVDAEKKGLFKIKSEYEVLGKVLAQISIKE